ncbi:MAG: HAD family phosphatase [Anderseniella sp.]
MSQDITTIICDFDGVLSDYHLPARLEILAQLTGLSEDEVVKRIWKSGFEDKADAGEIGSDSQYLREFNTLLNMQLSRDQWVQARLAAMQHRPDMHALLQGLGASFKMAMLTNNGPLMRACFSQLAPETSDFFGEKAFFSCDFKTKKPNPRLYKDVATKLEVEPAECLFIDDKQRHCDGAKKAGMRPLLFSDINTLKQDLAKMGIRSTKA